ncbi:HEPN domain-containing protein [Paraburkholderia phenazinium]|uniref:RiboL-PSP-HEPN domain-containing protein n=1 Tax=Paraburkholderia phenazinium TaxID=60549 RepID=A0A1N6HSI0_9BURK|nr:HEPN domain-containing protein [Paraburkholderia phenazinium]SIO22713.1 hypothetical protein SAMN05444168_3569 [Paraburkholderia phenazinium]
MSTARDQLVGRIGAIQSVLSDPLSTDISPVPTPNSPAVVIRNGCMVMLFSALEGFLRDRSLECAKAIDQAAVPYTHLPAGLKAASLIATFEGLGNLPRGLPMSEKLSEFEQAAVAVASGAMGQPYQFTHYSFGRDKSNITSDDVSKIAKSFGVDNFWKAAGIVSQKAGMAMPGNVDEVFKQLARERHKAAHVPSHNVPHSQLVAALPQALTLALSFDTLVSAATKRLSTSQIAHGVLPTLVTGADVDFLTLKPRRAGRWAAFVPNRVKALFTEADFNAALVQATSTASSRHLSVVCQDSTGRASVWRTVLG